MWNSVDVPLSSSWFLYLAVVDSRRGEKTDLRHWGGTVWRKKRIGSVLTAFTSVSWPLTIADLVCVRAIS